MQPPLYTTKQQLQDIQQTIEKFESAGAELVFSKPEIGLVVRLRPGVVDLVMNDGHRCKVVKIDLSHPSNAKLLHDLALGLKEANSLAQIESPLVKMGMTIQCLSQPFFEKMSHAKGDTIKIATAVDGSHKLVGLKADIPGLGKPETIDDAQVLAKVNTQLQNLGVHGKYHVEIGASKIDLEGMDKNFKKRYLSWLIEPLPLPSAKELNGRYAGLTDDEENNFEKLLKQSSDSWKKHIWQILKNCPDEELEYILVGLPKKTSDEELQKRKILQAVIEEYAALRMGGQP